PKVCENVSKAINLQAGKRYYIEAVHAEGLGGDNLAVAWKKEGEAPPADGDDPIPGSVLIALADSTVTITKQPADVTTEPGKTAVFTVAHSVYFPNAAFTYQWFTHRPPTARATTKSYTTDALPLDVS